MIDLKEVEDEIIKLEHSDTTYSNCSKLAVLYSIMDHLGEIPEPEQPKRLEGYSFGSSEFLTAVSQAPIDKVLEVLDEHMDNIQLLYPKEYSAIINRIKKMSLP